MLQIPGGPTMGLTAQLIGRETYTGRRTVDTLMDQLHCPAESTANASSNDKDSPTATPLCEATSQSRWCSGSLEDLWGTKCAVDEAFLAEPVEQRSAELVRLYCPLGQLPTLLSIWPGDLDVIAVV